MKVKDKNPNYQPRLIRHRRDFTGGTDSAALHGVLMSMMQAEGRGALTSIAAKGGMPISATRKRLLDPLRAFDEFTFKMVAYVTTHRRDKAPKNATVIRTDVVGSYQIDVIDINGATEYFWSVTQ